MSKTLNEVIDAVRNGEQVDYDDMRYAICAMSALTTFDRQAFMKLAEGEREGRKPFMVWSAQFQWEEHFGRHKRAGEQRPKDYVGWNNDPDNPEFQKRRGISNKLMQRALASTEVQKP